LKKKERAQRTKENRARALPLEEKSCEAERMRKETFCVNGDIQGGKNKIKSAARHRQAGTIKGIGLLREPDVHKIGPSRGERGRQNAVSSLRAEGAALPTGSCLLPSSLKNKRGRAGKTGPGGEKAAPFLGGMCGVGTDPTTQAARGPGAEGRAPKKKKKWVATEKPHGPTLGRQYMRS